jgi:hypothetical protein
MVEWLKLYFIHLCFHSAPNLGGNKLTSFSKDAFIDCIYLMHEKCSLMISIGIGVLSPYRPPSIAV